MSEISNSLKTKDDLFNDSSKTTLFIESPEFTNIINFVYFVFSLAFCLLVLFKCIKLRKPKSKSSTNKFKIFFYILFLIIQLSSFGIFFLKIEDLVWNKKLVCITALIFKVAFFVMMVLVYIFLHNSDDFETIVLIVISFIALIDVLNFLYYLVILL